MASKRRLRRKQCGHKRRYENHDQATVAMHQIIQAGKKRGGWLRVYRCRFCNGYHFGHAMKQGVS